MFRLFNPVYAIRPFASNSRLITDNLKELLDRVHSGQLDVYGINALFTAFAQPLNQNMEDVCHTTIIWLLGLDVEKFNQLSDHQQIVLKDIKHDLLSAILSYPKEIRLYLLKQIFDENEPDNGLRAAFHLGHVSVSRGRHG